MKHLEFLMNIIERMASNSASCKTWAITILVGLIALSSSIDLPWIIFRLLVVSFFFLDAHYLGLEKLFRSMYDEFVTKLNNVDFSTEDLYRIRTDNTIKKKLGFFFKGMISLSTWLFYLFLIVFAKIIHNLQI
ncbi:MAG TPA: hypothetical protein GX525_03895 [Bacilli bacterium]|nr:hypothetical protein [Bacilli bacterium]